MLLLKPTGKNPPVLLPSRWSFAIFHVLWLAALSLQSLPASPHGLLLAVSVLTWLPSDKDTSHTGLAAFLLGSIIHNSQELEATKCPLMEGHCMEGKIHTVKYYSVAKRKEILTSTTTWMNLDDIKLSEISQLQNDNYCIILFMRGI